MWAVVPAKDFTQAKQRLADVLSADQRRALFAAMFEDVLAALGATAALAGVLVVTRDATAAVLARRYGAVVLEEAANRGQSAAVATAAAWLAARHDAEGMLAVPGDVPLATAAEFAQVIAAHGASPAMTIVPARDGRGSNCLVCSPPELIDFQFGNDSCAPHLRAARAAGVTPRVLRLPGLGLDIDRPDDLAALVQMSGYTRAQQWLRANAVAERLAANRVASA